MLTLQIINLLHLNKDQCRIIDRDALIKNTYTHYLFKDWLNNSELSSVLNQLLSIYHPQMAKLLFKEEALSNSNVKLSEEQISTLFQSPQLGLLTDEQITVIEAISNVTKSDIKLKMCFVNIMKNEQDKNLLSYLLTKLNLGLKNVLFQYNTENNAPSSKDEFFYLEEEYLNNQFKIINDKYGYYTPKFNIVVYQHLVYAITLFIQILEKYYPNQKIIDYLPEAINEIAYKILTIFDDNQSNDALAILKNFENYLNVHNFKNSPLNEVMQFALPINTPVNKDGKDLLTAEALSAWQKLIRENGPKSADLFIHAANIAPSLIAIDRGELFLMAPCSEAQIKLSGANHIYLYKEKSKRKNKVTDDLCYYIMINGKRSKQFLMIKESDLLQEMFLNATYDQTETPLVPCQDHTLTDAAFKITQERYHTLSYVGKFLNDQIKSSEFLDTIYSILAKITYKVRYEEDPELALLFIKFNKAIEHFNFALDLYKKFKKTDNLPNIILDCGDKTIDDNLKYSGYFIVKLPCDDKHALLLGDITNCCQRIGGHAIDCVIDGVTKQDHGFYVLLKKINPKSKELPLIDGKINYTQFKIVGQSYCWISASGNLVLDSWENLKTKAEKLAVDQRWEMPITDHIIANVLPVYAKEIAKALPNITSINIGIGGETPLQLRGVKQIAIILAKDIDFNNFYEAIIKYVTFQPMLIFNETNNHLTLCRLEKDGIIKSYQVGVINLTNFSSAYISTEHLPEKISIEIAKKTNSSFRKIVKPCMRETLKDGYQYYDSLKQITIYRDDQKTVKLISALDDQLAASNDLTLQQIRPTIHRLLPNIPSLKLLNFLNTLLFDSANDLNRQYFFNYLTLTNINDDNIIELIHSLYLLQENNCLDNVIRDSLWANSQQPNINSGCFISRTLIYIKLKSVNANNIEAYLNKLTPTNLTHLHAVLQDLQYAMTLTNNTYINLNLLTQHNITIVINLMTITSDEAYCEKISKYISEIIHHLKDSFILSNELLAFINEIWIQYQPDINGVYKLSDYLHDLRDITDELFHLENEDKKNELLCLAAKFGDARLIRFLISQGVNVDTVSTQPSTLSQSPLILAVMNDEVEAMSALIQLGANKNALITNHVSLMTNAIKHCHFQMINELLKHIHYQFDLSAPTIQSFINKIFDNNNDDCPPELLVAIFKDNISNQRILDYLKKKSVEYTMAVLYLYKNNLLDERVEKYLPFLENNGYIARGLYYLYKYTLTVSTDVDIASQHLRDALNCLLKTPQGIDLLLILIIKNNDTHLALTLLEQSSNSKELKQYLSEYDFSNFTNWIIENKLYELGKTFVAMHSISDQQINEHYITKIIALMARSTFQASLNYDDLDKNLIETLNTYICDNMGEPADKFASSFLQLIENQTLHIKFILFNYFANLCEMLYPHLQSSIIKLILNQEISKIQHHSSISKEQAISSLLKNNFPKFNIELLEKEMAPYNQVNEKMRAFSKQIDSRNHTASLKRDNLLTLFMFHKKEEIPNIEHSNENYLTVINEFKNFLNNYMTSQDNNTDDDISENHIGKLIAQLKLAAPIIAALFIEIYSTSPSHDTIINLTNLIGNNSQELDSFSAAHPALSEKLVLFVTMIQNMQSLSNRV